MTAFFLKMCPTLKIIIYTHNIEILGLHLQGLRAQTLLQHTHGLFVPIFIYCYLQLLQIRIILKIFCVLIVHYCCFLRISEHGHLV